MNKKITIEEIRKRQQVINILIKIQEFYEEKLRENPNIKYEEVLNKYFGVKSASKLDSTFIK